MKVFLNLIIALFLFTACQNNKPETKKSEINDNIENVNKSDSQVVVKDKGKARISLADSPKFSMAKLVADKPTFAKDKMVLNFKVQNFKLGINTPDHKRKFMENDDNGQYIAVIINNKDFYKCYDGKLEIPNEEEEYEVLAFLCRSYNESIKHSNANQFFKVNTRNKTLRLIKDAKPGIYLNRPATMEQFEYGEIDRILLDSYIVPNNLHPDNFRIRVTINGELFMMNKWQCHNIDRLKPGIHEIEIMLMNQQNQLYKGENTRIKRTFEIVDKRNN